jgi:hypothetical protein
VLPARLHAKDDDPTFSATITRYTVPTWTSPGHFSRSLAFRPGHTGAKLSSWRTRSHS